MYLSGITGGDVPKNTKVMCSVLLGGVMKSSFINFEHKPVRKDIY